VSKHGGKPPYKINGQGGEDVHDTYRLTLLPAFVMGNIVDDLNMKKIPLD
jgi:hypothetical protein